MWLVLIVFLGEPSGGVRPIGRPPLWARVWNIIRRRLCSEWERRVDGRFFWGMSASAAGGKIAWVHNALAACARAQPGWASSALFIDLRKFYEHISHQELSDAAEHAFSEAL
eukprot:2015832-Pyramimonas_sp.AAC.1